MDIRKGYKVEKYREKKNKSNTEKWSAEINCIENNITYTEKLSKNTWI